ncbi:arsinothricin resistance N-acetyltransferase ArsN1 [Bacillus carboniphilus]|uniref:Arsinothricin resistance N-acetyltransferase ArsN1 n=1 Tax=Bacillus carboniphilus TaxID=86663 RepID=A0ABN0VVL8_9BACI
MNKLTVRDATLSDIEAIRTIYNQGIEDRIATLEVELKTTEFMKDWFCSHGERYSILVAERNAEIVGWASLNPYSPRAAYRGVADLSVYIARASRGKGVGTVLLQEIEKRAVENDFHKIVLFTFPFNQLGQTLYNKMGYQEVGTFRNQGIIDGKFVDVMAMEKLLRK